MANKEQINGYFAGRTGDQGTAQPSLLPTKARDGAPPGNKWLMHFTEGEVEVRRTKDDDYPYISYRAEVDEPEDFAGRGVYGMFFFPRPLADDAEDGDVEKYDRNTDRVIGQLDAVLGEGTCANLEPDNLEAALDELVSLLENASFVGKIGKERGKKVDPDDEGKDAERYPDRNRISYFEPGDTWTPPDDSAA